MKNVICNGAVSEVLNLLERDEDLMKAARDAGMQQEDLDLARADRKQLENLSIAELNQALEPRQLFNPDSPYVKPPQAEAPAPQKQKETDLAKPEVQKVQPTEAQQVL